MLWIYMFSLLLDGRIWGQEGALKFQKVLPWGVSDT